MTAFPSLRLARRSTLDGPQLRGLERGSRRMASQWDLARKFHVTIVSYCQLTISNCARPQVGHEVAALTPDRTFDTLYVRPLLEALAAQNPNNPFTVNQTVPK